MKGIKSTTNQADLVGDTFRSFLPKFIWSRLGFREQGAKGGNSHFFKTFLILKLRH
jgi:hypothetical protein